MHKQFILAALEQAWFGRGFCSPNPSVGAVAVHGDTIVAQAWHRGVGTAHAEQLVIDELSRLGMQNYSNDITIYVTLEPCNHWGRTPPCVSAIIDFGIKRVVYAFSDPNPVVASNNTPAILQSQGIEVIHFEVDEVTAFYQSYYYWMKTGKPWITAKLAQSFDGKIAGENGQSVVLSNEGCQEFTHFQRLYSDVILTTARTIINDDPQLNVRLSPDPIAKSVAILDAQLSIPADAKIFKTAAHCIIYHNESLNVTQPLENCSYYPMPAINNQLDLSAVCDHLGQLGFHDVWVEGGGILFSALHQQQLVNQTYLYLVPSYLGSQATPAFHHDIFQRPHTINWYMQANNMIARLLWQEDTCLQVS